MRAIYLVSIILLFFSTLTGCASEGVKRSAYEAIYQKGCMDRVGSLNCDPEHKGYDQYKNERGESLKR